MRDSSTPLIKKRWTLDPTGVLNECGFSYTTFTATYLSLCSTLFEYVETDQQNPVSETPLSRRYFRHAHGTLTVLSLWFKPVRSTVNVDSGQKVGRVFTVTSTELERFRHMVSSLSFNGTVVTFLIFLVGRVRTGLRKRCLGYSILF